MFGQETMKPLGSFTQDSTLVSSSESHVKNTSSEPMEQSFPHKLPTPPSSRPSSLRRRHCRSLHGNSKGNTKPKTSQTELIRNFDDKDFNFQKYKLLPAIASQDCTRKNTEDICNDQKVHRSQTETLVLAFKLLDGSRHQHCFSKLDTFTDVIQHLRSVASHNAVPSCCEFITCEVPLQIFSDLSVSLSEAGIKTRTLLYLREVDLD